jgi:hypothetical protein
MEAQEKAAGAKPGLKFDEAIRRALNVPPPPSGKKAKRGVKKPKTRKTPKR